MREVKEIDEKVNKNAPVPLTGIHEICRQRSETRQVML